MSTDSPTSPVEAHEPTSPELSPTAELHSFMDGVFSGGNPKHALQGLSSGLYNVAAGLALGVTGLVASTVSGYNDSGAGGAAKGFGLGAGGCAALTLYGAYAGCRQAVRGIANTPEAWQHASQGDQYWDSARQRWVVVSLTEEFDSLPTTDVDIETKARALYKKMAEEGESETTETAAPASSSSPPAGGGVDYYAALGVERTASTADIKKAFTRKALVMHPDKNPGDPEATKKFQELMTAYNTLSNDAARDKYDKYGADDSAPSSDAAADMHANGNNPLEDILNVGFLEPLVGKLNFMRYFQTGVMYTDEMLTEMHYRRRLRIARQLVDFLDGGEGGMSRASDVLRDAVSTPCGPQLVAKVAAAYETASRQYLRGNGLLRELDSFWTSKAGAVQSTLSVMTAGADTAIKAVRHTLSERDVMLLLAAANEADVSRTVLQACRICLVDSSVSDEVRRRRADGLRDLSYVALAEVERELASRQAMLSLTETQNSSN